jgi:hypothetical protein
MLLGSSELVFGRWAVDLMILFALGLTLLGFQPLQLRLFLSLALPTLCTQLIRSLFREHEKAKRELDKNRARRDTTFGWCVGSTLPSDRTSRRRHRGAQ